MESITGPEKPSRLSNMLGPGFRFHPTDEELVQFYLRRKVSGKGFRFDAITDVDVYKTEPWDLPCMPILLPFCACVYFDDDVFEFVRRLCGYDM